MNQTGSDSAQQYLVAGLRVSSEIPLPELVSFEFGDEPPDLKICEGSVPENLAGAQQAEQGAQVTKDAVLLNIPGTGRYLASGGKQILVQPDPAAIGRNLRLFLLGSALGAIYFQRGFFPLHASVVVVNGAAVAFSGDSGAGKSTLAAWMSSQGYPLLCDDVCVVRFNDEKIPMAYPAFPRLKLWQDALEALNLETDGLQRDYKRAAKYHLAVDEKFQTQPVPLKHINVLQFTSEDSIPRIESIAPAEAVHLLRNNTYRFQFISGLGLTASHFEDCVKLARHTGVHTLSRPRRHSALAECQLLIEQQMQ